ncbi:DUF4209 domain-containing protein [Vibrio lentus]|uniref:DUF4209 domain-containing protein n=1 Tax=Vibrio lentus TaxID=136468 RepID=UPI000C84F5AD|nr:DUF4209 domain-containing protein [Vibrio lentus]PMJ57875.1 hypothetical protein BCU20_17075 [Vibrio lentus]
MTNEHVEVFKELDWDQKLSIIPEYDHSYEFHLHKMIEKENEPTRKEVISMLGKAISLKMHHPESVNCPFTSGWTSGTRTPEDFSQEELDLYEAVLPLTDDTWLKARLSDILWLWTRRGKKPDWARFAIDSYTREEINPDSWLSYQDKNWERAIRLCLQLKDFERLSSLTKRIIDGIYQDHCEHKFMVLWLSKLLVKTGCCSEEFSKFFTRLVGLANELHKNGDYYASRMYMELAIQISDRFDDKSEWLDSLEFYADCFEKEGDSRLSDSSMIANSFYEQAIEAYRKIPNKHRTDRKINEIISKLKHKVTQSGAKILDEMSKIEIPMPDVSDIVDTARNHVSGKVETRTALLYFCGLAGSNIETMRAEAAKTLEKSVFKSLIGMTHISQDGRVIGRSPAHNFEGDKEEYSCAIYRQLIENYLFDMNFITGTSILPALDQLLEEHSFSREFLESLCFHSPLVPNGRERTLGLALWLGFEHDFSAAINLLCPQVEHIVRTKLKEAGEHTTTIENGIEHEIGLSSLVDKPKFVEVFGETVAFELKAIFAENLGCNFRNEVAHGLLDDNNGQSYYSVYAWWYVLRMICHSLARERY